MSVLCRVRTKWLAALLLAIFFVSACSPNSKLEQHQLSGLTMGTSYTIKWFAAQADPTIHAAVTARLAELVGSMSTYEKDSELSRLNHSTSDVEGYVMSPDLARVIGIAAEVYTKTEGSFDPTVGPLVNLWGFGPGEHKSRAPSSELVDQARSRVGFSRILVDQGKLAKPASTYLDLSAVAKGDAVDQLGDILDAKGISTYMVEVGGEVLTKGKKPSGQPWRLAIESPVAGERSVQRIVALSGEAIATSGDYRNYFEENGVRFSHTIDPVTGRPITHKLASVSVITDSCAMADALATALMVMGTEKALAFAAKQHLAVFLISKAESGFVESYSPEFAKYLVE